ncbi:MAG TPA: lipoprotein insertase outer membrane protein LolB, partial [Acidobacteriota bacterium]
KKILILFAIAGFFSCQTRRPDLVPPAGPHFRSLAIKFSFHDSGASQNGRVSWRFDDHGSKFLFFTPLNLVAMELDVAAEDALLVNHDKKAFWRGDFSGLLDRMWGIALTHSDLKSLLAENGTLPAGLAGKGIAVALERAAAGGTLETVRLRRGDADLALHILKDELRPGKIILVNYAERYQPLDLERVLEND